MTACKLLTFCMTKTWLIHADFHRTPLVYHTGSLVKPNIKARNPYTRLRMRKYQNPKINREVSLYTDACAFTHDIQIQWNRRPQDVPANAYMDSKLSLKLGIHMHVCVCVCVYGKYQNPKIDREDILIHVYVCVYAWYSNTLKSYAARLMTYPQTRIWIPSLMLICRKALTVQGWTRLVYQLCCNNVRSNTTGWKTLFCSFCQCLWSLPRSYNGPQHVDKRDKEDAQEEPNA